MPEADEAPSHNLASYDSKHTFLSERGTQRRGGSRAGLDDLRLRRCHRAEAGPAWRRRIAAPCSAQETEPVGLPAVSLMHPTLIPRPVHHDGWIYEEKVDGCRPLRLRRPYVISRRIVFSGYVIS